MKIGESTIKAGDLIIKMGEEKALQFARNELDKTMSNFWQRVYNTIAMKPETLKNYLKQKEDEND